MPCKAVPLYAIQALKLRLHEASRETGQVGRLRDPSYLPRVKVYLPEIITCFQRGLFLISGKQTFTRGR
jgi:hypothetical protein